MRVWGVDNQVLRNLVILMVFPGTFNDRSEVRTEWEGAIEVNEGVRPILQGNHVAGSERTGNLHLSELGKKPRIYNPNCICDTFDGKKTKSQRTYFFSK